MYWLAPWMATWQWFAKYIFNRAFPLRQWGHATTITGPEGNKTNTSQKNENIIFPEIEDACYPTLLHTIWHSWSECPLDQDKVMLWAAFTTYFFGFMRSGELCIKDISKDDEATDLTFADVAVDNYQNPSPIRIHLKSSKTDQFGKGTNILLARTKDQLCPVAALLHWLVQRGNAPGPLVSFASRAPLTRPQLVASLRAAISAVGGVASDFSGHSFRSGAATTATQLNIPDSQIQLLGRWKSNAFQRYIKPPATRLA